MSPSVDLALGPLRSRLLQSLLHSKFDPLKMLKRFVDSQAHPQMFIEIQVWIRLGNKKCRMIISFCSVGNLEHFIN